MNAHHIKGPAVLLAAVLGGLWPAPALTSGGVRVETSFDNSFVSVNRPGERHLEIEVIAPDGAVTPSSTRPPLNLSLVIDKSGSMAEAGKLEYVKQAAREMVDRLRYGDRFSLVAYDDEVQVLLPSEAVEDPRHARRIIDRLFPGGSTNLGGGLVEGYEQVRRHYLREGVNRVLLLSDGLANRGITDPRQLSRIIGREGGRGISLSAFGVGHHFNEDLLASLAEGGRGTYYYIDRPGRIGEILAREFSFIEKVVAMDITIIIEVRPGVVIDDIMGYDYRREGNSYRVTLGDMAAGERRRVMLRIGAPSWEEGDHRLGEVGVVYRPQGTEREARISQDIRLQYVTDQEVVDRNLNREVTERSIVFEANAARYEAAKRIDRGDIEGARDVLGESRMRLEKAPVQSPAVRDELAETEAYDSAVGKPLSSEEKAAVQKDVKYRSYQVLQSK